MARDQSRNSDEAARRHSTQEGHRDNPLEEGVEPDFTDDVGTTDPIESAEEAEPYFPPTDPVIRPASNPEEGAEVVGGFSPIAADASGVEGDYPVSGNRPGDQQVQEAVVRELREDARTTELQIGVWVRQGVVRLEGTVPLLEDAEAAEEVAARVEGVAEVLDELEVAGQSPR